MLQGGSWSLTNREIGLNFWSDGSRINEGNVGIGDDERSGDGWKESPEVGEGARKTCRCKNQPFARRIKVRFMLWKTNIACSVFRQVLTKLRQGSSTALIFNLERKTENDPLSSSLGVARDKTGAKRTPVEVQKIASWQYGTHWFQFDQILGHLSWVVWLHDG